MGDSMLTAAALGGLLSPPMRVLVLESVDSTNTVLGRMAGEGAPEGTAVLALEQTAGRGQRGRTFFSPAGSGVYMSLLLRPRIQAADALAVTPAAAVAASRAIEAATGRRVGIKWVNDVLLDGKKVCGILTEAQSTPAGALDHVICGLGINICEPEGGFPPEISGSAGALFETYPGDERVAELVADVLNGLWELASLLPARDFLNEYRERSVLTGGKVSVSGRGEAEVLGIDGGFRLLVRFPDGGVEALESPSALIQSDT